MTTSTFGRRSLLAAGTAALAAPALSTPALAQAWPQRDLRLVVPFPPGGTTDVVARLVAAAMRDKLGRAVVVENQPGAGSTTAAGRFAREGDDHALFVSQIASHGIAPALYTNLTYNPVADFRAVTLMVTVPNVWVANPRNVPDGDVRALLRDARARPGLRTYASAGIGTSTHLTGELIAQLARAPMQHVPYRGAGPGMIAVMGGEVDTFIDNLPTALPQIRAGTVKPLAVTAPARLPGLPDVPALAELGAEFGMAGFAAEAWFGLHTHRSASDAVVARMGEAARAALADPALRAQLAERGTQPQGNTPAAYDALVVAELARWRTVVRQGNITVQ
ncbi:Bug family tripartite tricarboxylate transporter substrate binding protein [Falsiroseomonas selenitidurans]|uniref:Tripartite tricarboxylate transporter substrate binding protein n=1 Tax=Falsiroseomonas selenitidurans TaxID=2716335 RepID=A0ABX1E0Q6_9PROT|nr:tripartite tricarboxylate transporter substrate-binding protein [Falsiroseomonas selenitidurans]NKC30240.1 tripartite tricarboxylate transporter substrate binding protein [Falsiroseomonas selenitidurans]